MKNDKEALTSGKKWFPCNKGGGFRKWYGNQSEIINWEKNGYEIKNFPGSVIRNEDVYFMQSISWNMISSGALSFRYFPEGFVLNNASNCIAGLENSFPMLGYLSSKFILEVSKIINPTLNLSNGVVARFPYMVVETTPYCNLVKRNIYYSKLDWDAHETSWDFKENPLVAIMKEATRPASQTDGFATETSHDPAEAADDHGAVTVLERLNGVTAMQDSAVGVDTLNNATRDALAPTGMFGGSTRDASAPTGGSTRDASTPTGTLEQCVNAFEKLWTARFMQLHANEEELNRQFIDIYGLQDELTPDVPLNEITILQQGEITIE